MLVPHTPRASFDVAHEERPRPRPGLFDLPLELREEIYEYCLAHVSAAAFVIYKHAQASNWSFRRNEGRTCALLLVCKDMRCEVRAILDRTSAGPTLRINPAFHLNRWFFDSCLYDKADETQSVFDLGPFLASTRRLRVELNIPGSSAGQDGIRALLQWLVASLNSRARSDRPLERVQVTLTPGNVDLWPSDEDSVGDIIKGVRCGALSVSWGPGQATWHRWERSESAGAEKGKGGRKNEGERGEERVDVARRALLASCKSEVREAQRLVARKSRFWFLPRPW